MVSDCLVGLSFVCGREKLVLSGHVLWFRGFSNHHYIRLVLGAFVRLDALLIGSSLGGELVFENGAHCGASLLCRQCCFQVRRVASMFHRAVYVS